MVRRTLVQRLLFAIAATVVALFAAQQAQAQTTLYVGGGATFPTSDMGDVTSTGWQIIGGVLFPVGPEGLSIGAEGFYGQNSGKDDSPIKISPYGVMGIASYGFSTSGSVTPYIFGGLGLMVSGVSWDDDLFESSSESSFGYQLGAGVEFGVSESTGIFVEGKYMGSSDAKFFGLDAGLAFALGG